MIVTYHEERPMCRSCAFFGWTCYQ